MVDSDIYFEVFNTLIFNYHCFESPKFRLQKKSSPSFIEEDIQRKDRYYWILAYLRNFQYLTWFVNVGCNSRATIFGYKSSHPPPRAF